MHDIAWFTSCTFITCGRPSLFTKTNQLLTEQIGGRLHFTPIVNLNCLSNICCLVKATNIELVFKMFQNVFLILL